MVDSRCGKRRYTRQAENISSYQKARKLSKTKGVMSTGLRVTLKRLPLAKDVII